MAQACQLTEISKHDFPELIQFYRHFPKKYPFLLTTSSHQDKLLKNNQVSDFDILFIEPQDWLKLDQDLKLTSSSAVPIEPNEFFLDAFDRLFLSENQLSKKDFLQQKKPFLPFTGGWFVFLAYELAQQIEPCLNLNFDKQLLPVAYAARVKKALIFDHNNNKLFFLSEFAINHEESLQSLLEDSKKIQQSKQVETKPVETKTELNNSLTEDDKEIFLEAVSVVKRYIKEGDVFQVNLSRLWESIFSSNNITEQAYYLSQLLSKENPAPFSGLANIGSEKGIATIISSSPERLIKVQDNYLESRPIAGTHPRGYSEKEDSRLLKELHAHPKEQAEHIMLIDLIRNDLGRVCVPGTVSVDELMVNESYAHVHHIVSNVSGELQADITPGNIIKAMFPGGTITGCPKVRCMEIIAELEQQSRGAYTGSMGYINLDGSMDLNILIRTMVLEEIPEQQSDKTAKQKICFRAGAGLVFDSIAEKELLETRAKAKGLLKALGEHDEPQ
ncbi:MAG: aminodeoxychorismate synthase component I [Gammaproteobacteria bacterium]|nr:aminodeoxychorismate synthase component I [Gammaproteobacteria bacterium]